MRIVVTPGHRLLEGEEEVSAGEVGAGEGAGELSVATTGEGATGFFVLAPDDGGLTNGDGALGDGELVTNVGLGEGCLVANV